MLAIPFSSNESDSLLTIWERLSNIDIRRNIIHMTDEEDKKALLEVLMVTPGVKCMQPESTLLDMEKTLGGIFDRLEAWTKPGSYDQIGVLKDFPALRKVAFDMVLDDDNALIAVQRLKVLLFSSHTEKEALKVCAALENHLPKINNVEIWMDTLTDLAQAFIKNLPHHQVQNCILSLIRSDFFKITRKEIFKMATGENHNPLTIVRRLNAVLLCVSTQKEAEDTLEKLNNHLLNINDNNVLADILKDTMETTRYVMYKAMPKAYELLLPHVKKTPDKHRHALQQSINEIKDRFPYHSKFNRSIA